MKTFIKHICVSPARWLAVLALLVFTVVSRADDTNTAAVPVAPRRMENRFLFIIDVSSAMAHSSNTVQHAVLNLLASEIGGQLRDGDTIGMWTFSDKLHLTQKDKNHPLFPMQIWHEDEKNDIARRFSNFLKLQKYEKKSDLKKVLPEMYARISASQTLTAIIISDGSNPVTGTPFDDDINDLQKRFGAEFRAANLPLVTVLATREGEVFDYTVNSGADTIRVPQTAAPFAPKIVVVPPPPPPPAPEPKHVEIVVSPQTNSVTGRGIMTNKPAPVVVVPPPKPEPTFGADVSPGVVQVIKLAAKGVGLEPLMAYVNAYPKPFAPSVDEILLLKDSGIPDPVVSAMVSHLNTPVEKPAPKPAPVVAQVETPAPVEAAPAPAPAPVIQAKPPSPVPATTAATVSVSGSNPLMLIMAISLLAIAIVLIIFLVRRPKAAQPSLISQSINRKD